MIHKTARAVGIANRPVEDIALYYQVRQPWLASSKRKAVVVLHGARSNGQDIFMLTRHLPADHYIIAPKGPYSLVAGGHAWYEIDFSSGRPATNVVQEARSRQLITDFVKQVKKKYELDEVYLCGFSQGAVMAYTVALTHPELFAGVMILSGRIPPEIRREVTDKKALKELNVFVAHGLADVTLPISYARDAKDYLQQLEVRLSYEEFDTGHEITHRVLAGAVDWLRIDSCG